MRDSQGCGSVNISFVSGSADPDPGCQLITCKAGSGSYVEIFVAIKKNVLSTTVVNTKILNFFQNIFGSLIKSKDPDPDPGG
jgi:hypothetical protein